MCNLDHASLQHILAKIFFGDYDAKEISLIVPKQGNWLNPQSQDTKVSTWIGYLIRENPTTLSPRSYSYVDEDGAGCSETVVTHVATIDLQFVGVNAEQWAQSVCLWDSRDDVAEAFLPVSGQLMNRKRNVVAVPYWQDGGNTILSFNVTIYVVWANVKTIAATKWNLSDLNTDGVVTTE